MSSMVRTAMWALVSAAACLGQTPLALELVVAGLQRPVLVTAPPGDLQRLFVVQQTGQVRIVRDGQLLPTPFLDLSGSPQLSFGGERGLLGLAFHPDYAQNGRFYVFRNANPGGAIVVERYEVSSSDPDVADPASQSLVLTTPKPFGNHNGGTVAFGPDGYLYVSIGDGGSSPPNWPLDPFNHAQRGDSLLGKMLRLDVDAASPYAIPSDNPFVQDPNVRDEIWAIGLRNPWRCSFDRLTGDLYIADVGGQNEEVDFEPAGFAGGRNYGWSCMAGTACTGLAVCACNGPDLTPPLHEYDLLFPAQQAIIGGYAYRGAAVPDLRGSYLFADYMTARIWSLQHDGTQVTQLTERTAELVPPAPYSLTGPCAFGEDGRGELYLCNLTGEVYRIVPTTPQQVGVTPFGVGTPGCAGAHALSADSSPVVGNPAFALRCSNAPQQALGLLAFSGGADVAGSDPLGVGLLVHVQPTAAFFVIDALASDANGVGRYALPIPGQPSLVSVQLHAQAVWGWPASACQPTSIGWSSSAGLSIVLQP